MPGLLLRRSGVASLLLIAACNSLNPIHMHVAGFSGGPATSIPQGSRVALLENPRAANPLLERELFDKFATLLRGRGFAIAPFDSAEFAVMAFYGIGSRSEVVSTEKSAGVRVGATTVGSVDTYVPETITVNDRWLTLVAVDVERGRRENRVIQVWRGEAKSSGSSSDLRRIIDYMLVPMSEVFGRNQGQKPVMLRQGDGRVQALRRP